MIIRGPFISPMPEAPERSPLPVFFVALALGFLLFVAACLLLIRPAYAHDAPSGWSYPQSCCSNFDCRQVPAASIGEISVGYLIKGTGEVLGYSDNRLRKSPDGEFHWCSQAGTATGKTICLFVPPRGF